MCLLHNIIHCPKVLFSKQINCKHSLLTNVRVKVSWGGKIDISNSILNNCEIILLSDNCTLEIRDGARIKNTRFYLEDPDSKIIISNRVTIGGGEIASTEGRTITIGEDCMLSEDIEIRNGDSHSIVLEDDNSVRINKAQDVVVGRHVWITAHVRIMKGTIIPDNCIIANSSVVTGKLKKTNAIYGGSPARILKDGINWNRSRYI